MATTIDHSALTGASLHEPKGADTASAGDVYITDGAGSGAWKATPGSTHALLYLDSNTTATTITTVGTYYPIAGTWTQHDAEGMTTNTSNGKIIVSKAGDYVVSSDLSMLASRNGVYVAFKVMVNGTEALPRVRRKIDTGADVGAMSVHTILHNLSANDEIQISVTLTGDGTGTNGDTITVSEASFMVILLKES